MVERLYPEDAIVFTPDGASNSTESTPVRPPPLGFHPGITTGEAVSFPIQRDTFVLPEEKGRTEVRKNTLIRRGLLFTPTTMPNQEHES